MDKDQTYMMRAIELAKQGEGLTRPNPPVGAVLVLDDQIIAEGWHKKAGSDHAERACLKKLPPMPVNLKDATLYVTLEPCSTHGKTPPCTDIILEKGVGRVVVSVVDLNPAHAGRGLTILEDAGVEVRSGVCEEAGRELIAPFEKRITTGLPFVTLKLASTLDGKIADCNGDSKWITGPEARERVQDMRRRADAIMVGAATVRADDPSLLPRPSGGRKPWRVIVGTHIPEGSRVRTDEFANQTLVRSGDLRIILKELAEKQGVMHVFCEGGGKLAAGLIGAGLVDELALFMAPKLLGSDGLPNFGKNGALMAEMTNLRFQSLERVGKDILIKAIPED
ncbi:bifunctional diaminohydroxyphosphoribosylaminopyrimidine deaminase/5-amino-6-(5-phosphoribosylamino)uracil reductase RibD [Pontiella agarivorans]|uniref:Riboflavin biosynthesis protein RibD n=1 Tax=Pontiella agarivorans TaxID=3038953 RepID=A0ABU5MSC2_9BACT|nr:bifunctional diaminohydroxyphosphoribosylaminopyrimidine deaminase/5-amino-6-(5-phosphoribosylamino)uracil reductase RibD [Pontiella agarivorans]MDZ8117098.1 bifunctional diaminohydroxyphosphoribosylaminopyrimidine deaminase/5-amino-6-(5-phosphoribosylamino)uracil reductase RibD [Pontiella agarivorans]